MIGTAISLASHALVSSYKLVSPVTQVIGYVLPYFTMASSNVDYNTKHLKKGDPLPPYNGKLRVYNMRFCPFAQRTILALNAKNVDFEVVNIDLGDKPEWLPTKSPFGKVPSIEIADGICIYESLITVEYLDQVYPQRPLLAQDPVKRAYEKIIVEAMGPVQTIFYKSFKFPETITDDVMASYYRALDFLQDHLRSYGTKFLGGNDPGFADYMIWPWFERIVLIDNIDSRLKIDAQKYKLLTEYFELMLKDPAVMQYALPKETLTKYCDLYKTNEPINYDAILQN